jgi:hypothetical protein
MRMRNMLYPAGELRPHIEAYERITGKPLDRGRICYHTVSAMLQTPMGIAESMQNPSTAIDSIVPRFGWDVTLRRGLCDALCEAEGISVEPPELPKRAASGRSSISLFLVEYLEKLCFPLAKGDAYNQYLMRGAVGLARAVECQTRYGARLERDNLQDMEILLGHSTTDFEVGMTLLAELIGSDHATRTKDILWLFSRMERRREFLWAPLMIAQHSNPLERLYPATPTYQPAMIGQRDGDSR